MIPASSCFRRQGEAKAAEEVVVERSEEVAFDGRGLNDGEEDGAQRTEKDPEEKDEEEDERIEALHGARSVGAVLRPLESDTPGIRLDLSRVSTYPREVLFPHPKVNT